jgi:ATP-dependent Zn protease
LFIDELDSIGNRETFSGHAQTYQTTVVNYLLEEIDGFADRSQIIVIAATNHEKMIDPALRRAGRLDQVVRVSYPTMPALKGIYEYHLRQHQESGDLADDIDLDALASMSFGLTGADVEFFVRGAARRARKRRDQICQEDLLSEVLRRPRSGIRSEPFSDEMVHRLAVHEAGHATARLFGRTRGEEITYVSIAPRSDGRVGYIAAGDTSSDVMIRDDYLDRIQILLAGHAAEEVVFGTDGVSDLSGTYGPASDLAQATKLARHLLRQTGLGGEGDLLWWDAVSKDADVSLDSRVEQVLEECYATSAALLRKHREVLDEIAAELRVEQELDGPTLRALT